MRTVVKSGDVLQEQVDVLICTANPMLNMSGGVNGTILRLGGKGVQKELRDYLQRKERYWVKEGSVVQTGPGPLAVKAILHAVSINGFYESSIELVAQTLTTALQKAADLSAKTVATPSLATGYGPLSISDFARALKIALHHSYPPLEELRVVLRKSESVPEVRKILDAGKDEVGGRNNGK